MAESESELCQEWGLSRELAFKVRAAELQLEEETGLTWRIISGFRTREQQEKLAQRGRPAAPPELSTHLTCPATGADLAASGFVTTTMKATFGRIVTEKGLRWGGGSAVDPETGIPSDWNHVDLGPRQDEEARRFREQQQQQ